MRGPTWVIVVAAIVLVIGLVAYGRGPEHHRGSAVGERPPGAPSQVVTP